ncbi:pyridoxal phosphate-dependent aminotransferase [Streptomyces sp. NPDC021212]|uniref:pyridoxal phosphate-dependent aminotransferase n=1 Tax=Streptomyces sp. NPDC021212 TaxID=3365118 RepID=UPI0037AF0B50
MNSGPGGAPLALSPHHRPDGPAPALIDLASGQIVEPLPGPVRDAITRAMNSPRASAYPPGPGLPELRTAVAGHYAHRTGAVVDPEGVTITAGARHGLFAALAAVARGREVLVPAPHWSHYPAVVRQAGGSPVTVPGDPGHALLADPARLEAARTPRTAAVLVNSPVNPSGACYGPERMRALRAWAAERGVCLIVDDIYWAYGDEIDTDLRPGPTEIVVGGVSKVHALAGLRIGWVWADPDRAEAVRDTVEHTTGPVSGPAQTAAAAVLRQETDTCTGDAPTGVGVARRVAELAGQRARAVRAMTAVPYLRPVPPAGGIYLCLDASEALARGLLGARNDQELCAALRRRASVGLRAGSTFGMPGHLRLCVAESHDVLLTAARRLTACLTAAADHLAD